MKKSLITFACLFALTSIYCANPTFKQLHKIDLQFSPTVIVQQHTDDFNFFLNSTEKDMAMADGMQGKVLWTINFETVTGNKKIEHQFWNKDANVILLFNEDSKKGVAIKYFIDGNTGKLLWQSDKYLSGFGEFNLSSNFRLDYDKETKGVLLPTKETIDFVNVSNGEVIWSHNFQMQGKEKHFNCFIMGNYDLVRVMTDKDAQFYLTIKSGQEITDTEPYYNRKKAFSKKSHTQLVSIPEKDMYVVMKGKNSSLLAALGGGGMGSWKMDFMAFREGTHELLWKQNYTIAHSYDYITKQSIIKMIYLDGKIFVEHMPNMSSNTGLTVLDVNSGNKIWECYYTTLEDKGGPNNKVYTPFPAPDPIVVNGKAYVVDKIKNKMYCYASDQGKLLWETEKFPDAQKIPTLIGMDDIVILSYGGPEKKISCVIEEVSGFIFEYRNNTKAVYRSGNKKYTYKYIYNDQDKFGLNVYNAQSGEVLWSHQGISKVLKDKFSYIAGVLLFNNQLYVATDKNFFILDPKTGNKINSFPIKGEKVGDIWKFNYFADKNEVILNCTGGVVKIDLNNQSIAGSLKVANVQGPAVSELINGDCPYTDYAVFTAGDVKKMEYKSFASIDIENMKVRGTDDAEVIFGDMPRFSEGGEYFFKNDGKSLQIFAVK
jgi:outer membrane protein assembly factor BamB